MSIFDVDFKQIWLVLTHRCTLNCSYCAYKDSIIEEKPLSFWVEILDRYPKASYTIFGGEPLLYESFWELIDIMNRREIDYTVSTIGENLSIEDLRKLRSISISIDTMFNGKDSVSYKSMIGRTIVNDLRKEKRSLDFCGITVTRTNVGMVMGIVEHLRGSSFRACINVVHGGNELGSEKSIDMKPNRKQLKGLTSWIVDNYTPDLFTDPLDYLELFPTLGLHQDWRCQGMSTLCIDSDGVVSPCYLVRGTGNTIEEYQKIQQDCKGCFVNCFWMANEMPDLWRKVNG